MKSIMLQCWIKIIWDLKHRAFWGRARPAARGRSETTATSWRGSLRSALLEQKRQPDLRTECNLSVWPYLSEEEQISWISCKNLLWGETFWQREDKLLRDSSWHQIHVMLKNCQIEFRKTRGRWVHWMALCNCLRCSNFTWVFPPFWQLSREILNSMLHKFIKQLWVYSHSADLSIFYKTWCLKYRK